MDPELEQAAADWEMIIRSAAWQRTVVPFLNSLKEDAQTELSREKSDSELSSLTYRSGVMTGRIIAVKRVLAEPLQVIADRDEQLNVSNRI